MRPTVFASLAAFAIALPVSSFAAGGGADPPKIEAVKPSKPADPAFAQAKAMIEQQKNYAGAIPLLQQVVQRDVVLAIDQSGSMAASVPSAW